MNASDWLQRLERYSAKHPQEVWLVRAIDAAEPDEILVFRGFSSSLLRPTAPDLDQPVLSPTASLLSLDRLRAPYQADRPIYLERDLTPAEVEPRLQAMGL